MCDGLTLDVFARICVTHGGGGESGGAEGEGGDGIPASATVAAETATRQQVVADASAAKDPRQV